MKITRQEAIEHLREHFGLTMHETVALLNTPAHPPGMRDQFAIAATPIAFDTWTQRYKHAAECAYEIADAMLAERSKNANR